MSGITPTSRDSPRIQSTGSAMNDATGTVHRRDVRAPQMTTSAAIGMRTTSGMRMTEGVRPNPVAPPEPLFERSTSIHWVHNLGEARSLSAITRAVAETAIARCAHSRRTANQSRPIPGVTLVNSTNAHVQGQRNPRTMAAASSRWMFPDPISDAIAGTRRSATVHPRASQTRVAKRRNVQPARKIGNGNRVSGANSWTQAGE